MSPPSAQTVPSKPESRLACDTVTEAVTRTVERSPERDFTFYDLAGDYTTVSFGEIERRSARIAGALQLLGLKKGERLALLIIEPLSFVLTYLAAIRVGVVAVAMPLPTSLGHMDVFLERTSVMSHIAECSVLVVSPRLLMLGSRLRKTCPFLRKVVTVEDLQAEEHMPDWPAISSEDVAHLQFTSGSTAKPRAVRVTHACLLANAEAITGADQLDMRPTRDVCLTWLPMYHDMGLVGFLVVTLCIGVPVVFLPTLSFLRRPSAWLAAMNVHRATVSFAPNFAYSLVLRKTDDAEISRWDLSHVRLLGCGGEPINPEVVRRFNAKFHALAGLPTTALRPVYGAAEATLAMTLTPLDNGMVTRRVDLKCFEVEGRAEPAGDHTPAVEHVSCGHCVPGHEITVVDKDGRPLRDRQQGRILFRGPSVTPGYLNEPQADAVTFQGGWLDTGDLGYLSEGHLYVTGRSKDLIIHNARNIPPQLIEWAAEGAPGVRKGAVAAFSIPAPSTEEIVVVAETRSANTERVCEAVRDAVKREVDVVVSQVLCLAPGGLPKTSSGKLQRSKARELYLSGKFRRPMRSTLLLHALSRKLAWLGLRIWSRWNGRARHAPKQAP
jgi:fatty-acyl-CoA synthase